MPIIKLSRAITSLPDMQQNVDNRIEHEIRRIWERRAFKGPLIVGPLTVRPL